MKLVLNSLQRQRILFLVTLIIIFSTILAVYAYKGVFSRYLQDDYCYGAKVINNGYWQSQYQSYFEGAPYNGNRYSLTLFSGLAEILGGPSITIIHAFLWIVMWLLSLFFLITTINRKLFSKREILLSILCSEVIVVFTFYTAPELYQVLYWRSASFPYLSSIVFTNFLCARIIQSIGQRVPWFVFIELGLLSFISAGFSETNTVVQTVFWVFFLILFLLKSKKLENRRSSIATISLVMGMSVLGLVLLVFSPANSVQLGLRPPKDISVLLFIGKSLEYGLEIIKDSLRSKWLPFGILFITGAWIGSLLNLKIKLKVILFHVASLFLIVFMLCVSSSTPSVFMGAYYPENRALFEPNHLIVIMIFILGIYFSVVLDSNKAIEKIGKLKSYMFLVTALGIGIYGLRMLPLLLRDISPLQQRAEAWDKRQQWIYQEKLSGKTNIDVPAFDSIARITELKEDPNHWVNRCAADYYGVHNITAIENFDGVKPWFQ